MSDTTLAIMAMKDGIPYGVYESSSMAEEKLSLGEGDVEACLEQGNATASGLTFERAVDRTTPFNGEVFEDVPACFIGKDKK